MVLSRGALTVLGIMMLSLSTTCYQIFLSQGVCVGVGCGLLYLSSLTLVDASFKAKRVFAIGVVTCGIAVGGIVYTIAFSRLILMLGFGWTIRALGSIALALFVLSFPCLLLRTPSSMSTPRGPRHFFGSVGFSECIFHPVLHCDILCLPGIHSAVLLYASVRTTGFAYTQSLGLYCLVVSQATSLVGRLAAAYGAYRFGGVLTWTVGRFLSGLLLLLDCRRVHRRLLRFLCPIRQQIGSPPLILLLNFSRLLFCWFGFPASHCAPAACARSKEVRDLARDVMGIFRRGFPDRCTYRCCIGVKQCDEAQ